MVQDVTGKPDLQLPTGHRAGPAQGTGKAQSGSAHPAATEAKTASVAREQLEQAAARVREAFRATDAQLEIEIEPDLDRVVIKILNGESGEVIRQIPPQEFIELAKELDGLKGLLLRERV